MTELPCCIMNAHLKCRTQYTLSYLLEMHVCWFESQLAKWVLFVSYGNVLQTVSVWTDWVLNLAWLKLSCQRLLRMLIPKSPIKQSVTADRFFHALYMTAEDTTSIHLLPTNIYSSSRSDRGQNRNLLGAHGSSTDIYTHVASSRLAYLWEVGRY